MTLQPAARFFFALSYYSLLLFQYLVLQLICDPLLLCSQVRFIETAKLDNTEVASDSGP